MFCEKGVLGNFTKFTGKHLRTSFLIKLQVNPFSYRTPVVAASIIDYASFRKFRDIHEYNRLIRNWKNTYTAESQIANWENLQFWNIQSEWALRNLQTLNRTVKCVFIRSFIPSFRQMIMLQPKIWFLEFSNAHFGKVEKKHWLPSRHLLAQS